MQIIKKAVVALVSLIFMVSAAVAGTVKIDHSPISHNRAQLTVSGPNGESVYTPEELEEINFRRLTTITPWRDAPAAFDGVLLTDLLAANGIADASAINVIAENDYVVEIPSEVWKRWPILVATRVNGLAHTRRQKGPIQFILPMSEDHVAGLEEHQNNWVWMAARIEAIFE